MDYDERVLPSIGNEVLKSIVAQFDAAELITQREVVSCTSKFDLTTVDMMSGVIENQGGFVATRRRIQH